METRIWKRSEPPGPTPEDGGCSIVAHGVVRVDWDDLASLRKTPGPPGSPKMAPSLLKHADEQTVLGLAAVLRGMSAFGLAEGSFADWGVIAAPRFPGRVPGVGHIDRFQRQGPSTVSPLIIPNLALHSLSGTISLALKAHGTNFGVGGAHGHLGEGLLAALTASDDGLAGLWLVVTAWDPEPVPDLSERRSATVTTGYAAALALMPEAAAGSGSPVGAMRCVPASAVPSDEFENSGGLPNLVHFLSEHAPSGKPRRWYHALPGGAIELTLAAAGAAVGSRAG